MGFLTIKIGPRLWENKALAKSHSGLRQQCCWHSLMKTLEPTKLHGLKWYLWWQVNYILTKKTHGKSDCGLQRAGTCDGDKPPGWTEAALTD